MNMRSWVWMWYHHVNDGGVFGLKDLIFEVFCMKWEMVYWWCGIGLGTAVPVRVA